MPTASSVTSAIAIAACAAGAVIAFAMWRQRIGAGRAGRLRHPASPPPLSVTMDEAGGVRHWRIAVAATAPPTAIDIVTWRIRDDEQQWRSEAIVQPIEIAPGGWALTPGELPRAGAFDVVVAWTTHATGGDVEGSRTFRVDGRPTPRTGADLPPPVRSPSRWPFLEAAILSALIVAAAAVALSWGDDGDGRITTSTASPIPSTASPIPPTSTSTATSIATPVTTPVTTQDTTVPVSAATSPPTTDPAPTTSLASQGTAPAGPAPSRPPATTPPTSAPTGPRIEIAATIDECSAGPNCLVASFVLEGFEGSPSEYVCEFADGERIAFGLAGDEVARACATGSANAGITIEVAGVRSAMVTRADAG